MDSIFSEGFRSIDDGFAEFKKLFAWPQAQKHDVVVTPSAPAEEKKDNLPDGMTISYLFAHWKPFYELLGLKGGEQNEKSN